MNCRFPAALFVGLSIVAVVSPLHADERSTKPTKQMIADKMQQFSMLAQMSGESYISLRNDMLKAESNWLEISSQLTSMPPWRAGVQVRILEGWGRHRALYTAVLAELKKVDLKARRKTVVGISGVWDEYALKAKKEYKQDILPLAWEMILSRHKESPDWMVVAFLHMLAAVPDKQSIAPVLWLVENTDNELVRESAGYTLSRLPKKAVTAGMREVTARHRIIQAVFDNALYEMAD